MGLLLAVVVHAASIQDRLGAPLVLSKLWGRFPRLQIIWADGGYTGELVYWCAYFGDWLLDIIRRCDKAKGFQVLPRRWVVERTFAWLNRRSACGLELRFRRAGRKRRTPLAFQRQDARVDLTRGAALRDPAEVIHGCTGAMEGPNGGSLVGLAEGPPAGTFS